MFTAHTVLTYTITQSAQGPYARHTKILWTLNIYSRTPCQFVYDVLVIVGFVVVVVVISSQSCEQLAKMLSDYIETFSMQHSQHLGSSLIIQNDDFT